MRNKLYKVVSGLLFAFMLALLATTLSPAQTVNAAEKVTHSFLGCDYILKPNQKVQLSYYSNCTWSSENSKIASVDQNGKVTAKKAGMVNIYATTSSGYKALVAFVGVKTKSYYPASEKKYKIGKDIPAGEYMLFKDPKVEYNYGFWTTYPSNKKNAKLIDIASTNYATTVKLQKGNYVKITGGYMVPLKKASKSVFSLKNLNKKMASATKDQYCQVDVKGGYGLAAGTYRVTLSKKAEYGSVRVSSQPRGSKYNANKVTSSATVSKSRKTATFVIKKGQYATIQNCTLKKIK